MYISESGGDSVESLGQVLQEKLSQFWPTVVDWLSHFAGRLVIAIIVFVIGRIVIKLFTNKWLGNLLKRTKVDVEVHKFIQSAVKMILFIVLILGVVNILGFQTASLVTLVGSAALAVGLSLQGSLSNFAGGLLLLIFKPFKQGDYIVVGTNEGYVESVGILYTKLKTLDNKGVMLPNGSLSNSNITNFHSEDERRLDVEVDIPYDHNIKVAKDVLEAAMHKSSFVIIDENHPIQTVVKTLSAKGVLLQNRSWVKSDEYWPAFFEMQELIINAMNESGISIPYNQMDIHVSHQSDSVNLGNKETESKK